MVLALLLICNCVTAVAVVSSEAFESVLTVAKVKVFEPSVTIACPSEPSVVGIVKPL